MKSTSYKVQIKASVNGTTVAPKSIAWIHGNDSCLAMPCYKENDYFVIEIIPGCVGNNCIEGYITFGDQCDNCEPVYFKKCFCNSSEDCSDCEECNQYGLCQSVCLADEFCSGDQCCNCDANTPCSGNKICNGCKCVCAQGTFEKNGICVQCDENTILDKCHICVNGVITPIPCDGACDPTTGQCVDCLTGGDCSDRTDGKKCCNNKQCVCCEGTVWDPNKQQCVPQPCKSDDECGTCKKCTPEGCKPIECPLGYQCINDECVPECANKTCSNGADCGENCGCLNGECVPCTILSCSDLASCQAALGCKCNGAVCEPVDNCNEYCDGATPCLDTNCTCYNNNCVSCENFPCIEGEGGCNSYYNCKCNSENECGGGKACDDKFIIKKTEACSANGCTLEAVYTSKNKCMCDPIEFRVDNKNLCTSNTNNPILLTLATTMFKRGIPYSNYLSNNNFADNEIVTGSIKFITTYNGVNTTIIKDISAINTIENVSIPKPRLAGDNIFKVTVITESIKVNSNDCTQYENKQIAYFEIDLGKGDIAICAKLQEYSTPQVTSLVDTKSLKKPLIVWYRTSGNDFGSNNTKLDTTDYTDKGSFRKRYILGAGGTYSDKITKPEEGLLNNYRYKAVIDCGCNGATNAVTDGIVIFCCPEEYKVTPVNACGDTVKLEPFTNCSVNGNLDTTKYPIEAITKYFVSVNGKDAVLLSSFPTVNNGIEIKDTNPIKSLKFYQAYAGNAVVKEACEKSYDFNPVLPEFLINTSIACTQGEITVDFTNSTVKPTTALDAVQLKRDNVNLKLKKTNNANIYTTLGSGLAGAADDPQLKDLFKKSGKVSVTVKFTNGCTVTKDVEYTCAPNIDIESNPNKFAKKVCNPTLKDPDLIVTPSGFGENVLYSLNGGAFQSSNVFSDLPAGTYTVVAKEVVNGFEYTATSTYTIENPVVPTVTLVPSNICVGQSSVLNITGAANSVFKVYNPQSNLISTVTIGNTGTATVQNLTQAGNYTVTLEPNSPANSCFPFTQTVTLAVGGQQLTPTIDIQPGSYCVGQPVPFRILDNGLNATYDLSSLGTGTVTTPLQANSFSYNGTFTPSVTTGYIKITGTVGTCNTTTNPQVTVNTTQGPNITSVTPTCQSNNQHTVTVVATGATSVTVQGVAATNTSGNTWTRTNITGLTEAEVVVSNGTCEKTQTVTLQNCLCPTGQVFISTTGDTCGQGNTTLYYNGASGISPNAGWSYVFQKEMNGTWSNMGTIATFNPSPVPEISVPTTIGIVDSYRIKLINNANGCEYYSQQNQALVTAIDPPIGVSIVSSPAQPFLTNTPITFSTIAGYDSYTWSGDVNGNTNIADPVTFTTAGQYQAIVTVCSAQGCCVTETLQFEVQNNCNVGINIQYTASPCSDVSVTVNGGVGTRTYTVSSQYVNVNSTNVPTTGPLLIPITNIPKGASNPFLITITDSNNCSTSFNIPYTRCACICTNNVCTSSISTQSVSATTKAEYTTELDITSDIYVWFQIGGTPDRLRIVRNSDSTLLLDTYQIGIPNRVIYDGINKYRNFKINKLNIGENLLEQGGSYFYKIRANDSGFDYNQNDCTFIDTCPDPSIFCPVFTVLPHVEPGVIAKRSNNYGTNNTEVGIYIKIPYSIHQGSQLYFEGIPYKMEETCGVQESGTASFTISCEPIQGAGTI